ncbi:hypothetical protein [Nitrospira sp. Nam80]
MPQDMMEDKCSGALAAAKHPTVEKTRALTHDERKAAEAAFRGDPFNPAWSVAAAKVYAGIVTAMIDMHANPIVESEADPDYVFHM